MTFTSHLHTVQRIKISGAIRLPPPPVRLYALGMETFTFTLHLSIRYRKTETDTICGVIDDTI
jgi:hypothetical protein